MILYHYGEMGRQVDFRTWIVAQAFFGLLLVAGSAYSQTATEGHTLKLNGVTCRFCGIDAPKTKHWCGDYPAGVLATATLETLTNGRGTVTCKPKGTDRYGRTHYAADEEGRNAIGSVSTDAVASPHGTGGRRNANESLAPLPIVCSDRARPPATASSC
jgi:hypothetical protein